MDITCRVLYLCMYANFLLETNPIAKLISNRLKIDFIILTSMSYCSFLSLKTLHKIITENHVNVFFFFPDKNTSIHF